jgi:hypothetical protein
MASVTLAESAKLAQNELVAGVIENVITVNRFFEVLPFDGIEGNALAYNRENVLGDVQNTTVGDAITAKAAATFTQVTSSLTTIIGDAEVNGLIQATRSGDGNDQTAMQIASKAKSCGRQYQDQMITGDGTSNTVTGLVNLVSAGQTIADRRQRRRAQLRYARQPDGPGRRQGRQVDYFMMHARTIRSYYGPAPWPRRRGYQRGGELCPRAPRSPATAACRSSVTTGSRRTAPRAPARPDGGLRRHPGRRQPLLRHRRPDRRERGRHPGGRRRREPRPRTTTSGASSGTAAWPCSATRAWRWPPASRTKPLLRYRRDKNGGPGQGWPGPPSPV